jgi:hypothetical protein
MKNRIHIRFVTSSALFLLVHGSLRAVVTDDGLKLGSNNTVPAGSLSIAAGEVNSALAYSMAMGWSNSADNGSLAFGDTNTVNMISIAGGMYNNVDANSYACMAVGEGNQSGYSVSTILLGALNTMGLQWGSAAIGNSNVYSAMFGRTGSGNVMIGQLNSINQTVSGAPTDLQGTVLVGCDNTSSATFAYAFGKGNIGQTDTVMIGTYGATVSGASLIVGNGPNGTARSNGLVVFRNGLVDVPGSLSVAGSGVLTQATAISSLLNQGFLNKATGSGATASPTAYIAIGTNATAEDYSLAIGEYSQASGGSAIAIGEYSFATNNYAVAIQGAQASGEYAFATSWGQAYGDASIGLMGAYGIGNSSVAISGINLATGAVNFANGEGATSIGGQENQAIGDFSYAFGWNSTAVGRHSYAMGYLTRTNGYAVSLGFQNRSAANLMPNMENESWAENGALFELGNGKPSDQGGTNDFSNAITTLKNGQTTITNKAWKQRDAQTVPATADPSAAETDSEGEALVVEGHTILKGKVVIEHPQGDISMGIYN